MNVLIDIFELQQRKKFISIRNSHFTRNLEIKTEYVIMQESMKYSLELCKYALSMHGRCQMSYKSKYQLQDWLQHETESLGVQGHEPFDKKL